MVYNALQLMAGKDIGAVLVVDSGKVVGILSERDYARTVVLKGKPKFCPFLEKQIAKLFTALYN